MVKAVMVLALGLESMLNRRDQECRQQCSSELMRVLQEIQLAWTSCRRSQPKGLDCSESGQVVHFHSRPVPVIYRRPISHPNKE